MIEGIKDTQALFNHVARHLLRQNEQSLDLNDECVYVGRNGLRCAVGSLIKLTFYSKDLEHESIGSRAVKETLRLSIGRYIDGYSENDTACDGSELAMLKDLALIHDHTRPNEWRKRLREVTKTYDLALIPELQGATP